METTMELDELKSAWQALDRQMQRQSALNLQIFLERKLDKVRKGLWRMYWGKIVQILFGDALIYFGIISAMRYNTTPHLLICSLFMFAYGLLIVIFGGVTLGKVSSIDYTASVLEIQKRVGALQRIQAIGSLCAGLPWWLLWLAIFMLEVKGMLGVDLLVTAPAFVWINIALGVAGLGASVWLYRRARDPQHPRLAKVLNSAPRSLRDAEVALEEIARFEQQ